MKKLFSIGFTVVCLISYSLQAQDLLDRFSSNPLPKLNVFGIFLSENTDAANYVTNDLLKNTMRISPDFEVFVDPTYKKLKDQKAFDISLFGKSASGKKYESDLDTELNLNANNFTLLIIDRHKRVRAFSQVNTIDVDNLSRVVEELLLNLDGEENITVDSEKPDVAFGWQTDFGKKNYEKENEGKLVIDLGAKDEYWYKYLGAEIPDCKLVKMDNSPASLYDLLGNKVSAVLVMIGSKETDAMMVMTGAAMQIMYMNSLYQSFTLQKAEPGDEMVENAKPDVE